MRYLKMDFEKGFIAKCVNSRVLQAAILPISFGQKLQVPTVITEQLRKKLLKKL